MDIEQAFFSEPGDGLLHEMRTKEELIAFQQKYETGFTLTDKEAEILVNYMDGHDYILGEDDGKLYRGDLDEKPGEVCWEEYSMDDAIDAVREWNYVIFSVNFINYCLNKVIKEEGYRELRATTH